MEDLVDGITLDASVVQEIGGEAALAELQAEAAALRRQRTQQGGWLMRGGIDEAAVEAMAEERAAHLAAEAVFDQQREAGHTSATECDPEWADRRGLGWETGGLGYGLHGCDEGGQVYAEVFHAEGGGGGAALLP